MEAEEVPDVSEKMEVVVVPFFTFHQVWHSSMQEPDEGNNCSVEREQGSEDCEDALRYAVLS